MAAAAALLALAACDVDDPGRVSTNQRTVRLTFDAGTALVPRGSVTLEGTLTHVSVEATRVPVLPAPTPGAAGWAYEGWISYPIGEEERGFVSAGRFRIPAPGAGAEFPTGSFTFTYDRDGTFNLTSPGTVLAQGQPLPDTLAFTAGVSLILAIEPDPDSAPGDIGLTHLLVSKSDLPDTAAAVDLIVPVSLGFPDAGDFSPLEGSALLNAATGEFRLTFSRMPNFFRGDPPADAGLIYQAWFVDDDQSPPRYLSIARFNPNVVGDARLDGAVNPGDSDGDGVPEPLDFERVLITIEPDMITAQQPPGQGIDTDGAAFPIIPYRGALPDVLR